MVSNRIIAFCLTAVTLFSSVSSASAAEASNAATFANGSFWDQMLIGLVKGTAEWPFGDIVQDVAAVVSGEVCPDSSDGLHRTSRAGLLGRPSGFDFGVGRYGVALCDYCGEEFKLYSQDLSERGEGFTEEVQNKYGTTYFDQNGFIHVYPDNWTFSEWTLLGSPSSAFSFVTSDYLNLSDIFSYPGGFSFTGIPFATLDSYSYYRSGIFSLPLGSYNVFFDSCDYLAPCLFLWGSHDGETWTQLAQLSSVGACVSVSSAGYEFFILSGYCTRAFFAGSSYSFSLAGHLECSSMADSVSNMVTVDTRPTSITGNYGIIGDNGNLTKVDTTTIVNEGSNTYYNPVTNTSYDLSGWTYDYSTRTYNLTTADDNSVTVTYGDENITINEGDTTYNVYYLVETPESDEDDSGSGAPGVGEDHTHDYTSEITTAASCLLPGVRTYSCSCGDTYTKSVPAAGHAWAISQQVNTTYDPDTGELLQQGYTVYVCNTCGDQYRDDAGTGPPNGSSGESEGEGIWDKIGNLIGTVFDGILGLIEGVLGGLLDGLISLATMISDKLAQVVDVIMSLFQEIPAMFTGFLDFLSAVFPFIPEEMMTLLTFGLAAVIFIGILGWFRR